MRVLVTWASKRGGTEGIGRIIGETLAARGLQVVTAAVDEVPGLEGYDAAIIGGALYANRWLPPVRRFVTRQLVPLRKMPVWFFSSGPLDDSADRQELSPPRQVSVLAERVGAKGHVTFGGRLTPDAKGFPASAMARTHSGDWRNPERIRAWAAEVASELPQALPGTPVDHPAHSVGRLVGYGVAGWALCGAVIAIFRAVIGQRPAPIVHAIAAPLIFSILAAHYFRARGARDPLPTAITWVSLVVGLDLLVVAALIERGLAMFRSPWGTWLPFALIFLVTWGSGVGMSMTPEGAVAARTRPGRGGPLARQRTA